MKRVTSLFLLVAFAATMLTSPGCVPKQNSPSVAELNAVKPSDEAFKKDVLESQGTVLVDFGAAWCGPCRILDKTLEKIKEDYDGRLKIVKIDVDANESLAKDYSVNAIPFVMIVKDGKIVETGVGRVNYGQIEAMIKPHVPAAAVETAKPVVPETKVTPQEKPAEKKPTAPATTEEAAKPEAAPVEKTPSAEKPE